MSCHWKKIPPPFTPKSWRQTTSYHNHIVPKKNHGSNVDKIGYHPPDYHHASSHFQFHCATFNSEEINNKWIAGYPFLRGHSVHCYLLRLLQMLYGSVINYYWDLNWDYQVCEKTCGAFPPPTGYSFSFFSWLCPSREPLINGSQMFVTAWLDGWKTETPLSVYWLANIYHYTWSSSLIK